MRIFGKSMGTEYRLQYRGALQPPTGFDTVITASAGPSGPVVLWSHAADRSDIEGTYESPGFATFPETRTSSRPRVALTAYTATSLAPERAVILDELPVAHPLLQALPDGRFIVAGARCAWRPEGAEPNVLLVNREGLIEREGTLGDGVEHMLLDDNGEIWIGYFDEGIFGNFGWGDPGPAPLGSAGIVRWSLEFEKLWEYSAVADYWLADCYALNVAGTRIWACPYTDFPVLEIASDQATHRTTAGGVSGPRGLLVSGENVAFIGDYDNKNSLRLGNLNNLSRLTKGELRMPNGGPTPPGTLVSRGSVAHLFLGADWYTFDLAQQDHLHH